MVEARRHIGCGVIGQVCKRIFLHAADSVAACTPDAGEVALACEAVLLGPEDPAADACAAVLAIVAEGACVSAVRHGARFTASQCKQAANCGGLLDVSPVAMDPLPTPVSISEEEIVEISDPV